MILGTYHSVSPAHLDDYLAEFDYSVQISSLAKLRP